MRFTRSCDSSKKTGSPSMRSKYLPRRCVALAAG